MLRTSSPTELIAPASPPSPTADIAVLGAGIVGLCSALALQQKGLQVTLYDATGAGSGASFGNAGLISTGSCIPISLPGMAWQVPRWLLDPDGPLALRPGYALQALPWVVQWLLASSTARVTRASAALSALHAPALECYRVLLGAQQFGALIRQQGQLHIWSQVDKPSRADRLVAALRRQHQVPTTPLDQQELRTRMPEIASHVQSGICFTEHANTISPHGLTQALLQRFLEQGGALQLRSVQRIERMPQGYRLWTSAGDVSVPRIVVAAGAHTAELLRPLGIRIPLEFERGYHVELPNAGVSVPQPFIYKDKAVAVTPMRQGLRFAGTVEIAGLRHAPNPRRAASLLNTARELFPGINTEGATSWFGLRPSTPDSVPVIDELPHLPGLYLACGHGHTGMTGAPMTGELIASLVTRTSPPLDPQAYALSRFS